jgi:hypothetical protein
MKAKVPDTGYLPLQDFMGLDHPDEEQKDRLQFIWNHYQKGRDRAETLETIKRHMDRLGQPPLGENQLFRLYTYTRLLDEARSINKEIKLYEADDKLDDSQ